MELAHFSTGFPLELISLWSSSINLGLGFFRIRLVYKQIKFSRRPKWKAKHLNQSASSTVPKAFSLVSGPSSTPRKKNSATDSCATNSIPTQPSRLFNWQECLKSPPLKKERRLGKLKEKRKSKVNKEAKLPNEMNILRSALNLG